MKLSARAAVGVVVAAIAGTAVAQAPGERLRDSAADSIDFSVELSEKPLDELPLRLPTPPKPGELIEYAPGRPASLRFFVDPASLAVGSDGIVRFTLVVRGDGATTNVSYEGIRCKTRERKVFAYGRADGSWHAARDPRWTRIAGSATEDYRFVLYENYFCPSRQIIATAREGVEALKLSGHPRAADLLTTTPMRR